MIERPIWRGFWCGGLLKFVCAHTTIAILCAIMANWKGKQGEDLGWKPCFMKRTNSLEARRLPSWSGGRGIAKRIRISEAGGSKRNLCKFTTLDTTPALRATPPDSGGEFCSVNSFRSFESVFLSFFLLLAGCANSDYRFERTDGDKAVSIPLKLDSLDGARDGESVTAEARFSNGSDSAQMNVRLFLRPPAEFVSGTYRVTIDGKTVEGIVECLSLDYQGGQGSVPSMGGKFVLKPGLPDYLPSTPIKRPLEKIS